MSLTAEDLKAISDLMDKKLEPIKEDISTIKEDIETMKEDIEITREATNQILEWFDTYQRSDFDKPFPAPVKEIV